MSIITIHSLKKGGILMLNINKIIYMTLICIGIGLGAFASSVSLLTSNKLLSVGLLTITYMLGILLVNARRKYPLFIKKVR